jgi:hypothetical protein
MKSSTWYAEHVVPVLIAGGAFLHIIRLSRYFLRGDASVGDYLTWQVDLVLALLMVWASVALIFRRREFAAKYDISSRARRIGYWIITAYITLSIPGHFVFITTGNTGFFEAFPWWFSLSLQPIYVVVIGYFATLVPRGLAPAGQPAAAA